MQPYADNFTPTVPVEDDLVHTLDHPFCWDQSCGCHEDMTLVSSVNDEYQAGRLTSEEAKRLVQGKQI